MAQLIRFRGHDLDAHNIPVGRFLIFLGLSEQIAINLSGPAYTLYSAGN